MSKDPSNMSKDLEKKQKEFEELVEVCRMAVQLFKQSEFQQVKGMEQNNIASSLHCLVPQKNCSASLIKFKPQGTVGSGEQVWKRSCTTARGGDEASSRWNVVEHDYLNDKKASSSRSSRYNGKDRDVEKVAGDRKGKRKLRWYYEDEEGEDSDRSETKKLCKKIMAKNKSVEVAALPLEFENRIREMGGDNVKLIIQKHMFAADVAQGQNRFSIPINQVREDAKDFLTEDEISRVPMELPLIEPDLELSRIVIRKWNYSGKSSSYALSGPWTTIRNRNKLKVGTEMQLWSFRVHGDLNLALVQVSRDDKQDQQGEGIARTTSEINAESRDQQHDVPQFKSGDEADGDGGLVLRDAAAPSKSGDEADGDGGDVLRDAEAPSTPDKLEYKD